MIQMHFSLCEKSDVIIYCFSAVGTSWLIVTLPVPLLTTLIKFCSVHMTQTQNPLHLCGICCLGSFSISCSLVPTSNLGSSSHSHGLKEAPVVQKPVPGHLVDVG